MTFVENSNVACLLRRPLEERPDMPAIVTPGPVISYRQLDSMVRATADRLVEAGVSPGQFVGLSFSPTHKHIIVMLAVAHVGAVSVPLHRAWTPALRSAIARRYDVSHVLSDNERYEIPDISFLKVSKEAFEPSGRELPNISAVKADAPFRLVLSSGTTGNPKGVLFSHGYMLNRMQRTGCDWTSNSRLITGDFNFAIGFIRGLSILAAGGTLVLPPVGAEGLLWAINANAVTHLLVSVSKARVMTDALDGSGVHFPTVEHLRFDGATPNRALLEDLRARCSPSVFTSYGMTEVGVISMATPEMLSQYPDCAGRVSPWIELEVVDDEGNTLKPGALGHIRISCEAMPTSYYKQDEHTSRNFRDGWFYPGDVGRFNEDGLLFVEGRNDNVLNIDGHKVNPSTIERVLEEHPKVSEAVVFSLPDSGSHGTRLAAALLTKDGTQDGLKEYCAQHLSPPLPSVFIFMDDFPRNPNGKVLRDALLSFVHTNRSS